MAEKNQADTQMDTLMNTLSENAVPDAAFADRLEARLLLHHKVLNTEKQAAAESRRTFWQSVRMFNLARSYSARPVFTVLLVLFSLLAFTGVAYAIGLLAGYVPGYGFISEGSLVLKEPVMLTKDGCTFVLDAAIKEGNELKVSWRENNYTWQEECGYFWFSLAQLEIGSGSYIFAIGGDMFAGSPAFVVPGDLPQNGLALLLNYRSNSGVVRTFRIPFEMKAMTAADLSSQQQEPFDPAAHTVSANGVTLQLSHVLNTPDKAILGIEVNNLNKNYELDSGISLYDKEGKIYPINNEDIFNNGDGNSYTTYPLIPGNQYFIQLAGNADGKGILLYRADFNLRNFEIDLNHARPGETIPVNQELIVDGKAFRLLNVRYVLQNNEILFTGSIQVPQDVRKLGIGIGGSPFDASWFSGGQLVNYSHASVIEFEYHFPKNVDKKIEIEIGEVWYLFDTSELVIPFIAPGQQDISLPDFSYVSPPNEETKIDPAVQDEYDQKYAYMKQFFSRPGWIHQISLQTDTADFTPLTSSDEKIDQWIEIDQSGKVVRLAITTYNAENYVTYQSLTVGRSEFYPLDGSTFVYNTPEEAGLDFGLLMDRLSIMDIRDYGVQTFYSYDETLQAIEIPAQAVVTHGSSECGRLLASCDLVTFTNPKNTQEYNKYWLDPQTGLIYKQQSSSLNNIGAEEPEYDIYEYELVTFETGVTPPADLLALFDKIYFPEE